MSDEQEWEYYRNVAKDMAASVTDEKQREAYEAEARRLADVFREVSKTPLDAAATVASFSRVAASIAFTPLQDASEVLDRCIIIYALAAGVLAEEELNPQPPEEAVIDPADFPGAYL